MAAVSGCVTKHQAQIIDRNGSVVSNLDVLTEVVWTRLLDDTSKAEVTVIPDADCCAALGDVRSWRHKLVISRLGEVVWEGPVIQVEWRQGQVDIFALDMSAWLARRVPHDSITFDNEDLAQIAAYLIEDGFAPDDPGHVTTTMAPAGVSGGREYIQNIGQTWDHIQDLADTGLDITVIGNQFILMPETWDATVGSLTDSDLPSGMVVAEDGSQLATRVIVYGDDDGTIQGESGGTDAYYGLLERSIEETSVKTSLSAQEAARSRRAATYPVPVFLDSETVTLSPEANVSVPHLVPGWCLNISSLSTCRPLTQILKISGVKVSDNGNGESVQVTLAPLSSEVSD